MPNLLSRIRAPPVPVVADLLFQFADNRNDEKWKRRLPFLHLKREPTGRGYRASLNGGYAG